jgi:hypothetical protein
MAMMQTPGESRAAQAGPSGASLPMRMAHWLLRCLSCLQPCLSALPSIAWRNSIEARGQFDAFNHSHLLSVSVLHLPSYQSLVVHGYSSHCWLHLFKLTATSHIWQCLHVTTEFYCSKGNNRFGSRIT